MAASIQEAFRFNADRILSDLKRLNVDQQVIAEGMGVATSHLSRWRKKLGVPKAPAIENFISVVNKYLPPDRRIKPEDLFRDPEGLENAKEDLLAELARRAGYEIKRS